MNVKTIEIKAQIKAHEDRIPNLRQKKMLAEHCGKKVAELQANRLDQVADGMAVGKGCDLSKIDAEIEGAKKSEAGAIEQWAAAQLAILKIEERISALQLELAREERIEKVLRLPEFDSQFAVEDALVVTTKEAEEAAKTKAMEALIARDATVLDNQDGRVFAAIIEIEKLIPELESEISARSALPSDGLDEGFRVIQPHKRVFKNEEERQTFKDSAFSKIEAALAPAAAIAEVQAETLANDVNKRELLTILDRIGTVTTIAVRDTGLVPPQWAFDGRHSWKLWTGDKQKAPVLDFLSTHGIQTSSTK